MGNTANRWRQSGTLSLWRYAERDRNYPGWHLTADRAGSQSLAELLDALVADADGAHRTLALSAPPSYALPPAYKSGGWVSAPKLRLSTAAAPSAWSIAEVDDALEASFGAEWIPVLRNAMLRIHEGETDYTIGPRGRGTEPLWLW